jgi:glycosyltransferase involved in cell wall biosynthesis
VKIALLSGSAGDGHCGVGDYAYELAQHLALDAEVHLYFDKAHGPAVPPFHELKTLTLHPRPGFSLALMPWLRSELAAAGHDIVHLQYPSVGFGTSMGPAFLLQGLTGMQSRSRLVATLHEWTTSHPLRKAVMAQILPSVETLILSNEQELNALQGKLGGRDIHVIPIGNQLTSQAELAAVWGRPGPVLQEPTGPARRVPDSLFHYGLPAKGKGLVRLLETLKLVRATRPKAMLYLGGEFLPGEAMTEEVLKSISELGLADAVVKLGHIPRERITETAEQYCLGVFPFDEGYSSKRSSVAALSHLDLPLVVGGGSSEEHPYFAPNQNTPAALAVLIVDLLSGRLEQEWEGQVRRQRAWARRFSFTAIAGQHLDVYRAVIKRGMEA